MKHLTASASRSRNGRPERAGVYGGCLSDARQAEVLGRRLPRALLNCTRQWGKSTITAAKAVHRAYFEPESLTVVLSPSARQSGEFLRKASGFARKLDMTPRGDGDNEISLLFPNKARIVGLPGSEATVRGFFWETWAHGGKAVGAGFRASDAMSADIARVSGTGAGLNGRVVVPAGILVRIRGRE
jgi:hypothetical protein